MRKTLMIAALAALTAAPSLASARTACEQSRHDKRVVGTVAGGVIGALAGSAIAGNSSNTAGVLIGGAAGAVAGNKIAKGRPCPEPVARSAPRPAARSTRVAQAAPTCTWQDQTYRDSYGALIHRQVRVCR